jgi:hypothetical protein
MAATVTINTVQRHGNTDRIEIDATIDPGGGADPVAVQASGWVSAMTNHFPPEAFGDDGHHLPGAAGRPMTPAERDNYYQRLVEEQHPGYFLRRTPMFSPPPTRKH